MFNLLQIFDGVSVYVVHIPSNPKSLLPVRRGCNPWRRPYKLALQSAIRSGAITEPGRYGIEIDNTTKMWKIHSMTLHSK